MKRREFLGALLAPSVAAALLPARPDPVSTPWQELELADLCSILAEPGATLIAADPAIPPAVVLDPVVEHLRAIGRSVDHPRASLQRTLKADVEVLDATGMPARRLWLELAELEGRARRNEAAVLVSREMAVEGQESWVPRFAAAARTVVHVRGPEFDVPPEVVPSHLRIPVEVYRGSSVPAVFRIVEPVPAGGYRRA